MAISAVRRAMRRQPAFSVQRSCLRSLARIRTLNSSRAGSLSLGLLLFIVTLPGLVDNVSLDRLDICLAEDVIKTFHAQWGRCAFEYDIFELTL
jgi:hypothetical protein